MLPSMWIPSERGGCITIGRTRNASKSGVPKGSYRHRIWEPISCPTNPRIIDFYSPTHHKTNRPTLRFLPHPEHPLHKSFCTANPSFGVDSGYFSSIVRSIFKKLRLPLVIGQPIERICVSFNIAADMSENEMIECLSQAFRFSIRTRSISTFIAVGRN